MNGSFRDHAFYSQRQERSGLPVFIAAVVSVAVHVFLFFRMSEVRFDVSATIPERLREVQPRKIANFERVREDPARPLEQSDKGDPSQKATVGLTAKEMSEIFEAPSISFAAPPVQQATLDAAEFKEIAAAEIAPDMSVWQPRQEVIKIIDRAVRDDIALLPRREIYDVERIERAPDYAPDVRLGGSVAVPSDIPQGVLAAFSPDFAAPTEKIVASSVESVAEPKTDESATPAVTLTGFGETPAEISPFKHVDNRLSSSMTVYDPGGRDSRKYFRIEINPRDTTELPTVRKDIVFVQDASRSLARERLYFCKEGLKDALGVISAGDRFNVVSFREDATFCFGKGWASPTRENLEKAYAFIDSLDSRGDTDLFRSLKSLIDLPRDSGRPLIVIVITDGKATTGITASSQIIAEFSKLNDNMSLFVLGTHGKANGYLLDMLSFCNRGRQVIVRSDRWQIPAAIRELADSCASPVLGRIVAEANVASGAEFFPLPSPNLYSGQPLVYYGSCPRATDKIILQIRGEGGESKVDCLFDIDLASASRGDSAIRDEWARRKMHSLIGEFARHPSDAILGAMRELSGKTGIPIPYFGQF